MQLKISEDKEPKDFDLSDIMCFIKKGIESIVDDEVTKRFAAEGIHSEFFGQVLTFIFQNFPLGIF